jgi:hypothetical protein
VWFGISPFWEKWQHQAELIKITFKKILCLVVQTRAIRAAARFSAVSRRWMFLMTVSEGHSLVSID